MFTASIRTTLLAAIALSATLGTASADSRLAAPAAGDIVVKAAAPCHVHPCKTQREHRKPFGTRHGIAAPVGTGGAGEPAASIRWPWQKKKNVDRPKF